MWGFQFQMLIFYELMKVKVLVIQSCSTLCDPMVCMSSCCCCCCWVTSVVSDSVRPHRWQPTRLHCPWDSPGKNTGVGCHFLLQCMKVKSEREVAQLCQTLRDPMDCSLPGSSVHGIFQARVLEWGAIAFFHELMTSSIITVCWHLKLCFCPWCLIPGWGRSPGEGNGYLLQYSFLENVMDRGVWWSTVHGVNRPMPGPSSPWVPAMSSLTMTPFLISDSGNSFILYTQLYIYSLCNIWSTDIVALRK